MLNLWNDQEASQYEGDLGLRVYTSRLLGREPALVLHGGGNTSVKTTWRTVTGREEQVLFIKGSGADLISITAQGFAPVRLSAMLELAGLPALSDTQMMNELKVQTVTTPAPAPSVETILHAVLPYKFVDHSHADAIVTITNTEDGERRIRELYGDRVVIIPYVMPGFDLARLVAERFARDAHAGTEGMVLLQHGLFTFGETARVSYDRMIQLVSAAEDYLKSQGAWDLPTPATRAANATPLALATLRTAVSRVAGFPMVMRQRTDDQCLAFAQHPHVAAIAQRGPATPDHIIRTKRYPMIGNDVESYAQAYRDYFTRHAEKSRAPKTMLDPAPRLVLDPDVGLCALGKSAKDAAIAYDIYAHTMDIILRAEALGGYRALGMQDLFDMEYWELEQAKLQKSGAQAPYTGEVAIVTGAASGIGKACVDAFLARGAAVVGLDISPGVGELYHRPEYLGLTCDVSDEAALNDALGRMVRRFGGIDMVVACAGVFPPGKAIADLPLADWQRVMAINSDANLVLMRLTHPYLKLAPRGGRLVLIGSRNVPAPGIGAAAYSASKAALTQLGRIAALEWGKDGIRVNTLHPDAVYDTGIWNDDVLRARAAHYGMSVEDYKRRNVLKREVSSREVGELTAELCGHLFAATTGAQIPIDGGSDRVI